MGRTLLNLLAAAVIGVSLFTAVAQSEEKPAARPAQASAVKTPATDLYALAESVSRRAKDLDAADMRMQEEAKILAKMKEEVGRQIAELDKKLAELEKGRTARSDERKAARMYIARVYKAMAAEDAAKRLHLMGDKECAAILRELKEKDAAKILTRFEPEFSVAVTKQMQMER